MEFVRRSWDQIKVFLDRLDRNAKVSIWAVLIAGLLATWLVLQYAGSAETVAITPFASGQQTEVLAALRGAGIKARIINGQVQVTELEHSRALGVLQDNNLLKADTSAAWDQFLETQNPWDSVEEKRQKYLIALQRLLSSQIGVNPKVRSAAVMISPQRSQGFGQLRQKQSATVTLTMEPGQKVNTNMAHAFAHAVSGAVKGMDARDVEVIDLINGLPIRIRDELDELPTTTLEHIRQIEERTRREVQQFLGHIQGVIVGVNVNIDPTHRKSEDTFNTAEKQPLASEIKESREQKDYTASAEAGARANTQLNLDASGAGGSESKEKLAETAFKDPMLQSRTSSTMVGLLPQQINVSINVPRSYIVRQYMRGRPEDTAAPTDADLAQQIEREKDEIVRTVEPLIAKKQQGVVRVAVVPDPMEWLQQLAPGAAESGVMGVLVGSDWVRPTFIGMLALAPLMLMVSMVRKATKQQALPSIEELAGLPPKLPTDDDLVGEASADEDSLAGMEVNEEELKYRKMAEQISEMIRTTPDEAGTLIGRWVGSDE